MERPLDGSLLLVGEGDFSLSVALVCHLTENDQSLNIPVIASSIESEETILKHKNAQENIAWLQEKGVIIHLNTDATVLHQNALLKDVRFRRIVFNFPHAGGKSNHKKNRKLLNDFFSSASKVLDKEGQIMVTLCKGQGGTPADKPMRKWHDSWQVVSMAANAGLKLTEVLNFDAHKFLQYKSTGFRSQDKGFHTEGAITHVFEKSTVVSVPCINTFSNQDEYIPGEKNLLKDPCSPVYVVNQMLCDSLSKAYDIPTGQESADDAVPPSYTVCRSLSDQTIGKCEVESKMLMLSEDVQRILQWMCNGEQPIIESFQCTQGYAIQPNLLPLCHLLICSLPIQHSLGGTVEVGKYKEALKNVLEACVTDDTVIFTKFEKWNNQKSRDNCAMREISIGQCEGIYIESNNNIRVGEIFTYSKDDSHHVHIAVILDLDHIPCVKLGIPDARLLWSKEVEVLNQFITLQKKYVPVSLYPILFTHDMSFWENDATPFDECIFFNIIRDVGGDSVSHVTLIDRYYSSDIDRTSRCYRLMFQSFDQVLSYNTSWKLQSVIRLLTAETMKVTLR
ncbi:hypothetical protein FSP39_018504 [Pinctada imbricata]|uniref:FDX-ACB domain-containing protein n=1 Tax=Pinctada imbricata TaxID=66713 RepID=A0AA88YNS5_PINIB|nr:hypothetical protein FSP39_018504 [Pinctada imbricata]